MNPCASKGNWIGGAKLVQRPDDAPRERESPSTTLWSPSLLCLQILLCLQRNYVEGTGRGKPQLTYLKDNRNDELGRTKCHVIHNKDNSNKDKWQSRNKQENQTTSFCTHLLSDNHTRDTLKFWFKGSYCLALLTKINIAFLLLVALMLALKWLPFVEEEQINIMAR